MVGILKAKPTLRGDLEYADALQTMTAADFQELAAHLEDLVCGWPRASNAALAAAVERWLKVAPVAAREWLQRYFTGPRKGDDDVPPKDFMTTLASLAAKADPEWALEHLLVKNAAQFENPNSSLMEEVVRQNPALAKEWMAKLEETAFRKDVLQGYIRGLAEKDPAAALALALTEKTEERDDLIRSVAEQAARQSSGAAREVLARIPDKKARCYALIGAADILAKESNTNVLAFLDAELPGEPDPESLANFDVDTGRAMIERDPDAMANWALGRAKNHLPEFLNIVLNDWSGSDETAFKAWIEKQRAQNPGDLDSASGEALADAQLLAADKLLESRKVDEAIAVAQSSGLDLASPAGEDFMRSLAEKDPAAAARLETGGTTGKARPEVVEEISRRWTTRDPQGAAEWIQTLPPGDNRDAALSGLVGDLQSEEPVRASEWISEFTGKQHRTDAAAALLESWKKQDLAGARAWLESLDGVDESWKARALRRMP